MDTTAKKKDGPATSRSFTRWSSQWLLKWTTTSRNRLRLSNCSQSCGNCPHMLSRYSCNPSSNGLTVRSGPAIRFCHGCSSRLTPDVGYRVPVPTLKALIIPTSVDVRAEDADNLKSQEDIDEFEASVAAFVSFHTFSARCTAAGLDLADRGRFHSQGSFISSTILQPLEEFLDCQIMAVAQWILLSGDVIHAECVKKQLPPPIHRKHVWDGWENGNGPVVWKQWADKLAEIAAALEGGGDPGFKLFEKNREVLTDMVEKARDKMIALEPGLLAKPGSEPVADSTNLAAEETNLGT
jgi:hypothetical protein